MLKCFRYKRDCFKTKGIIFGKIITLGTSFGRNNNLNTFHGFKCLSVMFGTQITHLEKSKVEVN